jgi:hypothetical protein
MPGYFEDAVDDVFRLLDGSRWYAFARDLPLRVKARTVGGWIYSYGLVRITWVLR